MPPNDVPSSPIVARGGSQPSESPSTSTRTSNSGLPLAVKSQTPVDLRDGSITIRVRAPEVAVVTEEVVLPAPAVPFTVKAEDLRCQITVVLVLENPSAECKELPPVALDLQVENGCSIVFNGAPPGDWAPLAVRGKTQVALYPARLGTKGARHQATCGFSWSGDDGIAQSEGTCEGTPEESSRWLIVGLLRRLRLEVNAEIRDGGSKRCDVEVTAVGHLSLKPRFAQIGQADLQELRTVAEQHLSQEEYEDALKKMRASLAIEHRVLDKSNINTANMLSTMASMHEKRGEFKKAIECHQQALSIKEQILGRELPDTADTLCNLGDAYVRVSEFDEAVDHFRRALSIRGALDPDHPDTGVILQRIGSARELQGVYTEALENYARALAIREAAGRDAERAESLSSMASVHAKLNDYPKAADLYRRALDIREEACGKESVPTAMNWIDLGNVYLRMGSEEWALDCCHTAFAITHKMLGPEHPKTATALHHLGVCHRHFGDYPKALECYTAALRVRETHEDLRGECAHTLNNVGIVMSRLGHHQRALEYHKRAYAIQESLLGTSHPDTNATLANLATARRALGASGDFNPNNFDRLSPRHLQDDASCSFLGTLRQALKGCGGYQPPRGSPPPISALTNLERVHVSSVKRPNPRLTRDLDMLHEVAGGDANH